MTKQEEYAFLKVDKAYFGNGLKPLEILILSQIDEYINNGMECYVTDEQFALYFGVTKKTVSNAMKNLEEKGYIKRNTELCNDRGQASRKRTLTRGKQWSMKVLPFRWFTNQNRKVG